MSKEPFDTSSTKKMSKSTLRSLKLPGEKGFIDTKSVRLSARQWREIRMGVTLMEEFLIRFPKGMLKIIDLTKEAAKNQVVLSLATLLQPITNVLDLAKGEITKELGINDSIESILNNATTVIAAFTGMLSALLALFTDAQEENSNLENLIEWLRLLTPHRGAAGFWGIINPWGATWTPT